MKLTRVMVGIAAACCCIACANGQARQKAETAKEGEASESVSAVNDSIVRLRFAAPEGYSRVEVEHGSFADFLQSMPLKPRGSDLHYYNGTVKRHAYEGGVVDVDFGKQSSNQCADAVIFLRALYLWQQKRYNEIHFNFTNGFRADYIKWAEGNRIIVNNKTWHCSWVQKAKHDYGYATFRKYLDIVYNYAGTLSLERELRPVSNGTIEIGDVLINGGSPGHAVIVVDKAVSDTDPTDAVYLIAQSFMPAQEIEVFARWFSIDPKSQRFESPVWVFKGNFHRRF